MGSITVGSSFGARDEFTRCDTGTLFSMSSAAGTKSPFRPLQRPAIFDCPHFAPAAFCRASLMVSITSSKTVVGLKLGGNERGGNSLNVAANVKTSSIAP